MNPKILYVPTVNLATDWQQHIGTYNDHAKKLAKQVVAGRKTSYLQFGTIRAIFIATQERVTILISETSYSGIITKPRDGAIESTTYSRYDGETANTASYTATTLGTSGGWEEGITKVENNVAIFPMTEASKLNFLLSGETNITEGNFVSECEYGNLYWTADVNDEVFTLSWKGTPTRHFPLDCYTNIPNFSTYLGTHTKQIGEVARFSAFDKYIYINCSKVESPPFTFPFYSPSENMASTANTSLASCIVLGASIDPLTSTILIVCLSEFFNGATGIATLSDGRLLKLDEALTEVSKNRSLTITNRLAAPTMDSRWITYWSYGGPYNGWSFIGQTDVPEDELYPDYAWSTHEYPWFADELGTTFTSSKGAKTQFVYDEVTATYSISKLKDKDVVADDKLNETVTYAPIGTANEPYTEGEGELDVYSGQGVSLQVDYATSGSYDLFFEPSGNSSIDYSFSATTDETTTRGVTRIYGPTLRVKTEVIEKASIYVVNSNSFEIFVGMIFEVSGLTGPYAITSAGVTFTPISSNTSFDLFARFQIYSISPTVCGPITISGSGACPYGTVGQGSEGTEATLKMLGPASKSKWIIDPNPTFSLYPEGSPTGAEFLEAVRAMPLNSYLTTSPYGDKRIFKSSLSNPPTNSSGPTSRNKAFWDNMYYKWCNGSCNRVEIGAGVVTTDDWIFWDRGASDVLPTWDCISSGIGYNRNSFVFSCSGYPATIGCKVSDGELRYFDGGYWATNCPSQWRLTDQGGTYTGSRVVITPYKYVCL